MSIPLVQNNEKDSINTSIIAIKRQIERINALLGLSNSEEIDTSVFATKDELQQAVTDLQPVDEVTVNNMQSVTSNAVAEMFKGTNPQTLYDDTDGNITMQTMGKLVIFNIARRNTTQKDYVIPEVNLGGYSSVPLMVNGRANGEAYFQNSTTIRSKLTGDVSAYWGAGQLIGFLK